MASKVILFAFLLGVLACVTGMVVISAGDLPTPTNQCAEGPSYWCQSIGNAKSCRATRHCIQTVWERQTVPEDNDSICEICKNMVQQARDQLLSNETQEEMKEVFEGSCNLMPIKMVRMKCNKLVDDFIPELIEMLASQMNPTMVCTTALLCNNAWTDGLLSEYKAAQSGKSEPSTKQLSCETCQAFMNHNSRKLQSSSQVDLQRILFNICGQLNSYSDACMALVSDNIENIYSSLDKKLQTDMCQPLGFCSEQPKPMRVSIRPLSNDRKFQSKLAKSLSVSSDNINDDMECQFCQALVKNVRNILISNTTEAEFIQVLSGLCKQTGTFAKECQALVDQYGEMAYAFVMNELDPEQTCRLLTLCSAGLLNNHAAKIPSSYLRIEPEKTVKASKLVPAEQVKETLDFNNDLLVGQDEGNAIREMNLPALPAERLVPGSVLLLGPKKPGCILCEYVLHEIVNDLHNVTVKEEIEGVVKNICKKLPSSIGAECSNLINTYGDAIFFLLSQELEPAVFCSQLQLCPGSVDETVKLPENPFRAPPLEDANTCALCEFAISMLDKRLEDNRTEESIREALEGLCQRLPKNVEKDCVRLVDAYAEEIIEMLLADLKPDEVCIALKMCQPKVLESTEVEDTRNGITLGEFLTKIKEEKRNEPKSLSSTTSPVCVMCEFAMATIEKRLLTNSTEEEIKRAIDFVCAHLPSTVADMCIDFVEQYGDEIFEMLTSEIAPKAVCLQMGLCTPVDKSPKLLGHKNEHESPKLLGHRNEHEQNSLQMKLPSKCEICEIVIEYLDKLLEDDTIEESIDHIIEKACVVIPRGAQDKCTSMVETYGPYLISQLGQMMNKTKVCQSLHLCKPPPGQVQLLGGKQCTWGPTYWCASPQHADACNALEHCQTKVWMKSEP